MGQWGGCGEEYYRTKELSSCHEILFSNPYIFATRCCRSLIFQTNSEGRIRKHHGMDGLEIVMQGQIREIYQDGYNGEIYGRKNLKDTW